MVRLNINGKVVDVPADAPLLWRLRDEVGLTGTKFGSGMVLWTAPRGDAALPGKPWRPR
jgi:aerobic-type carbon monoxide dehydrogenase small subunit (CoxS/CutS family)